MEVVADRLTAMDQLLENLRNLARPIELRKRCIDAKDLVESVWRDVQNLQISSRMQLVITSMGDTHLNADGHWLRQVLYNLLRNAVEASQETQTPVIEVLLNRTGADTVIQVKDQGTGIPPELHARLFEPFVSSKGAAGTGLGLSVSRRVIELHQGSLSAQSSAGGTSFFIRLPHGNHPERLNSELEAGTNK
jgi:signal transduction histidine kinase